MIPISVSGNTVMSQLQREPGEFIVDPWVSERATLVAEQRGRAVAATHLLRYAAYDRVGKSYRDVGEIRWFLFWPEAPYWLDLDRRGVGADRRTRRAARTPVGRVTSAC